MPYQVRSTEHDDRVLAAPVVGIGVAYALSDSMTLAVEGLHYFFEGDIGFDDGQSTGIGSVTTGRLN